MSVLTTKNIQEVFIAKSIGRTASVQITNPSATGYIADGEIVLLNSAGAVATTSNADTIGTSPTLQVVQRSGDTLIYSNKFQGLNIKNYDGASAGSASTNLEQIYEVGYSGSAGSIDVSTGLDYQLTLEFKHDDQQYSQQKQKYTLYAPYTATTQKVVAKELAKQGAYAFTKNAIPVTVAMLNSGSAATIGAITASVARESNVITYSGTATGVVAGSLIRIGGQVGVTGSGIGTAIPVYTVKEAHPTIANAFILDMPYMGASNAALPNADHGLIATEGVNWGIRISGKSLTFVKDFFKFKKVAFTLGLAGFGATTINKRQEAKYAQGDGRIVAEEESFCKGFQGALNRMTVPLPSVNYDAVATVTNTLDTTLGDTNVNPSTFYDCIMIEHFTRNAQLTSAGAEMPQVIKIFSVDGAAQTTAATNGTITVLNTWMATTPSRFATVTL